MTKRHFQALAKTLNYAQPVGNGPYQDVLIQQWTDLCKRIAATCQDFNPNFDKERFLVACGVTL